jgi:hypothetical protein
VLINAFKNVTGRYPPKNTWGVLDERFSEKCPKDDCIDEAFLAIVFDSWIAHGYNKTNYVGILDWYISESFSKQEAQRSHLTEVSA